MATTIGRPTTSYGEKSERSELMYAALWRILPGSLWVKIAILAAAAIVVITILMMFVFPAVNTAISVREVTVTQ
ncbi:hypothetical protein AINA4_00170 [Aurantimicrobium sp. INA4]|nr:hypothetical protein AINA4_00170 [Aurantimicrobium sp. INA4]